MIWRGETVFFVIKKGERLNKPSRKKGDIPLLTSTSMSNGISCFIDIDTFGDKKKIFSNKITVDMLSNIFYHGYKYFSDDNIHTLIFKDKYKEFDNVFVCIFYCNIATKHQNQIQLWKTSEIKKIRDRKNCTAY